jgi:putative ABC transport system permease protein
MELFLQDLKLALRNLRRAPGFTAVTVLTLALGIGANTAVFSLVRGLLLRPMPFPGGERLVQVWQTEPDNPTRPVAPANFLDWRRDGRSFEGLAAYTLRRRNLLVREAEQVEVASVSGSFLRVLGVSPALGRDFSEEDRPEAVLTHGLWQSSFGGDPGVLGRTLQLDESAYEIVGVLPPGPAFPELARVFTRAPREIPEVGVPIEVDVTKLRDARYLAVVGRLASGANLVSARAEMAAISARLEKDFPEENAQTGAHVEPLRESLVGTSRPTLVLMTGAVGFLLLIACVNVASLLLARALRRRREVAVRIALGAGRRRLVAQMLAEGLVLAALSGGLGLALALAATPLLQGALPGDLPAFGAPRLDLPVLAFTLGVACAAALLFSLAPALQSGVDPAEALHGARSATAGPRQHRVHGALVAVEVALAVVLVAGAGLLLKTLWRLDQAKTGVDARAVLTARVSLPGARSIPEDRRRQFYADVVDRLALLPGVEAAGAIQTLPFAGRGISAGMRVEGRTFTAQESVDTCWRAVTPGYFKSVGIPVLKGRGFDARDGFGAPPVALVNARLAERLWPGGDPIGQHVGTGMDGGEGEAKVTVIGIVGDATQEGLALGVRPEMYRPVAQQSRFAAEAMSVALRVNAAEGPSLAALREAVRAVNPQAPVMDLKRLEELRRATTSRQRGAGAALGLFGALALLLAAVGLYGVLAFVVGERAREFGVRLALGARPADILGHVLGRGMTLVGLGLASGLVAALALGRLVSGLLFEMAPYDAPTLASVVLVLSVVALAASYLPARRASRVDPSIALRQD